ncbi:phenolic acid decarboxylase [Vibrio mangrovi]|uniref:Phenolic acid decarboxylase n=1 Tax=Vibrio mangrovi TaxID=474394 RepID=A0A1Y6IVH8_9VIBR|nr:phenolic acid decarboxylase [Vibrio mangrovi]MDW6001466.1 phenolic acid decarboxylase [Vibrio mangrovi]SMS00512.1 Phenolic acid decarboxylase PadC [Vibrio mangrovi]
MNNPEQQRAELNRLIGKHLVYTYDNGWQYEIYVKSENVFDYRIHSGIVGGRWVTDQEAHIHSVGNNVYKISWDEPTGTTVSLTINLDREEVHGVIFFPRWVFNDPKKTVCYQNEHLDLMRQYRDAGPTYPKEVIDEFAKVTFIEDCGANRNDIIACAPSELPESFPVMA